MGAGSPAITSTWSEVEPHRLYRWQARRYKGLLGAFITGIKKTPLLRAGFLLDQYKLDNLNFLSLHAFLTAGSDERNLLAFFQAFEAVGLDCFEVNKQVVTGLWSDEAEAFSSLNHLTVPVWRLDMV